VEEKDRTPVIDFEEI
jgi:thiamine kinase-like enzyme